MDNEPGKKTARKKKGRLSHPNFQTFMAQSLKEKRIGYIYEIFRSHGITQGEEALLGFDWAFWNEDSMSNIFSFQKEFEVQSVKAPLLLQYKVPTANSTKEEWLYDIERGQFIRMLILEAMGFSAYYALAETDSIEEAREKSNRIVNLTSFILPSQMGITDLSKVNMISHLTKSTGALNTTLVVPQGEENKKPKLFHVNLFKIIKQINATLAKSEIPHVDPPDEKTAYDYFWKFCEFMQNNLKNTCLCLHISRLDQRRLQYDFLSVNLFINMIVHSPTWDEPDSGEDEE